MNDDHAVILEEAITRFVDECLQGKQPDVEEFIGRYPECKAQLKVRLQDLEEIDSLFDSLVRADEYEFPVTADENDLTGRNIAGFDIMEMIGRGGMGVVYLARDTKLDRLVAIKSLPSALAEDSKARTRLKREAKLLASLNHPNIAVIHEIIEQDKSGYLVLEYVPGRTLAEHIAHEPLPLEEALSIGKQIAEAISAAHKKGVIHRDLKPGNIKITPEGRVKVLDFGLAKPSANEGIQGEVTATEPGRIIGTPAYMSPEQARGKETDYRTDIWSFGCIMYQMLTNHLPFEGETATDTLARIIECQPDWTLLPQETPANLRTMLRCCLEKEPDLRLDNIADAAAELNEALSTPFAARSIKSMTLGKLALITGAVLVVLLSVVVLHFLPEKQVRYSSNEIRLVVLPFENQEAVEDESSTDIITAAIANRLIGISGFSVVSRRSAMKYRNKEVGVQQIAKELRVDYILEGTVQRKQLSDPNSQRRHIEVQLIRASDDTQVWAQAYPVDSNGLFHVESDIAGHVVQALDIALPEPERRALELKPTENEAAYAFYLRGNYYHNRSFSNKDWETAIQMYEEAIMLDPVFASAYARLSLVHSHMYWHAYDRSNERLVLAEQTAHKALELAPDLPEAHLALGFYYYWGHHDYDKALQEFAIVQKSWPHDSELLFSIGLVQRRLGKFDQALANIRITSDLDPISHITALEVGYTLSFLRRYAQAEHYYDLAISLAPDWSTAYDYKVWLYVRWHGNTQQARAVVEEAVKSTGKTFSITLANLDVYDGNYQKALDRLSLSSRDTNNQHGFTPAALKFAAIYGYMGDHQKAKEYYEQALDILSDKIAENPNDSRYHSSIGIAYAGLGEGEKAIKHGTLGVKLMPVSKDAVLGPSRHRDLALIYVKLGKFDDAINELEYLLSIPFNLSLSSFRNDPTWAPLRDHPRFKKLTDISM